MSTSLCSPFGNVSNCSLLPVEWLQQVERYHLNRRKRNKFLCERLSEQIRNFSERVASAGRLEREGSYRLEQAVSVAVMSPKKREKVIRVYTAEHGTQLRLKLERDNRKPSGETEEGVDENVSEAYEGARVAYDFLENRYGFLSVDGRNYPLISTVHYDDHYCNAVWNEEEMVYGDGDGKIFNAFTKAIDVCGHEIGHGLTQFRCGSAVKGSQPGLSCLGEAGGINEGLSDILGMQIKQEVRGETAGKSDWLFGTGLLKEVKGKSYPLRSMENPGSAFVDHPCLGKDSQISTYPEYLSLCQEKGNVNLHDSSGIPNKAFCHACKKVGGYSWEKVGKVYFEVMPSLTFEENFLSFANKTVAKATELFGKGSFEEGAVREGWKVVQVL